MLRLAANLGEAGEIDIHGGRTGGSTTSGSSRTTGVGMGFGRGGLASSVAVASGHRVAGRGTAGNAVGLTVRSGAGGGVGSGAGAGAAGEVTISPHRGQGPVTPAKATGTLRRA